MTVFHEILYAQDRAFLTPFETEILNQLHFARQNPKAYADKIAENLQYYDGIYFSKPGQLTIKTNEGSSESLKSIEFLRNQNTI